MKQRYSHFHLYLTLYLTLMSLQLNPKNYILNLKVVSSQFIRKLIAQGHVNRKLLLSICARVYVVLITYPRKENTHEE